MWTWVLICVLILVFGTGWLFLLGREVVRKVGRLLTDLDTALARVSEQTAGLDVSNPGHTMSDSDLRR